MPEILNVDLNVGPNLPIALLPVRLETRFSEQDRHLMLRVYPDDVHVDAFDKRLTEQEQRDGEAYRSEAASSPEKAWQRLAQRYGPNRARWIILDPRSAEVRPAGERRVPSTDALPKRWYVSVRYKAGNGDEHELVHKFVHKFENEVSDSLHLAPSADDTETLMEDLWSGGAPPGQPPGIRWMFDFEEAVRVGMATRIDLEEVINHCGGFDQVVLDRVLVFGANGSGFGYTYETAKLEALLMSHAYSSGLAFVPPGTPTNNTDEEKAGYGSEMPGPPPAGHESPTPGTNGALLMRALGLGGVASNPVLAIGLADAPHADDQEQEDARQMNAALWRPTWGYYLQQQMSPEVGASEHVQSARRHFIEHVRARGPFPAIRVRRQPYGILPVTSLERWRSPDGSFEQVLAELLKKLLPIWLASSSRVPGRHRSKQQGQSGGLRAGELLQEVLEILGQRAHPAEYQGRPLAPHPYVYVSQRVERFLNRLTSDPDERSRIRDNVAHKLGEAAAAVEQILSAFGIPTAEAHLIKSIFAPIAFPVSLPVPLVRHPLDSEQHEVLSANNLLLTERDLHPENPQDLTYDALLLVPFPAALRDRMEDLSADDRMRVLDALRPGRFGLELPSRSPTGNLEVLGDTSEFNWYFKIQHPLLLSLLWQGALLQFVQVAWDGLRQLGAPGGRGVVRVRCGDPVVEDYLIEGVYREPVGTASPSPPTPYQLVDCFVQLVLKGKLGMSEEDARGALHRGLPFRDSGSEVLEEFSEEVLEEFYKFWQAVDHLAAIGEASEGGVERLELLLQETLSLASHRLDAWVTSLASKRLAEIRAKPDHAQGIGLGGYGWVEDLRPRTEPVSSGGYIHAPSVNHATTAAVLRSGYLSNRDPAFPDKHPMAVDLSSRRVQAALELLEGVRAGQPLGALLGYRFERGLHERHDGLELDVLIPRFRRHFPLVAGKRVEAGDGAQEDAAKEVIGPTNVVDGLALLRQHPEGESLPADLFKALDGNGDVAEAEDAAKKEILALGDVIDAVSDLIMAESVHQMVVGNATRSGAALDAIARGEAPPPEFDVIRTPRTGQALTHRLLMLGSMPGSEAVQPPAGWPADTPRAKAEPLLNAWAGRLLGNPSLVRCSAGFVDPDGSPVLDNEGAPVTRTVRLGELGLAPIDVVYLGTEPGPAQQAELEMRIARRLLQTPPAGHDAAALRVRLEFEAAPEGGDGGAVPFAVLLEVARAVRRLFTRARPLTARDVELPENLSEAGADTLGRDDGELERRARDARCAFAEAFEALRAEFPLPDDLSTLDVDAANIEAPPGLDILLNDCPGGAPPTTLSRSLLDLPPESDPAAAATLLDVPALTALDGVRVALSKLALFGVQGAVPSPVAGATLKARADLVEQAYSVGLELRQRIALLAKQPAPPDQLEVIFGRGFQALPRFTPVSGPDFLKGFSVRTALPGEAPEKDPSAPAEWLHRVAHVRDRAADLLDVLHYAEALHGETHLDLAVGQLPLTGDGEDDVTPTWVALPIEPPASGRGRLSFVAWSPEAIGSNGTPDLSIAGLLVDEWVEVVPNREEVTGLTFQYDAPGTRPPQAILLAVPPDIDSQESWTTEVLSAVLHETLDLAKTRAVDLDALLALGHLLPALHL